MRCFRPLCARKDIVELLVRQGRLADIQMLNFFSIQLDREVYSASQTQAAATPAAPAATPAEAPAPPTAATPAAMNTDTNTASADATPAVEDAAAKLKAEELAKAAAKAAKLAHSREVKKKAWTAFHDRSNAVRQLAANESPVAWLKEVYAKGDEWSSSYLSSAHAVATLAAPEDPTKLRATGFATAVGCGEGLTEKSAATASAMPTLPSSIRVVLRLESNASAATGNDAGAAATFVTASVRLDQPGVVEKQLVNGMLHVRLENAEATRNEALSAKQVAGYQHVLTATAYSAILRKMEEVCALHATNTVRYDGLLLRNPAVQMRLAQLTCFRYGIDCLTDYVIGDPEIEEGEEEEVFFHNFAALLQMPLIESMALNIYAERALMDGMDGMWEMVRDTPLLKAVPHRSNPAKVIDYPYLSQLLNSSKYLLTASDGSMEEQALTFLGPLLAHGGAFGTSSGSAVSHLVQRLSGLTSGSGHSGVRLAAPHVNLSGMARQLEQDVARLLQMISSEPEKTEPTFVICVAQYISEVLANLAVIYRCTAALNVDEAGRGHREWLLAQAFGGASATRRQRLLDDHRMSRAVSKVLRKSKDLDNYSTHPIELMNASPRGGGGGGGDGGGADAAAAGAKKAPASRGTAK